VLIIVEFTDLILQGTVSQTCNFAQNDSRCTRSKSYRRLKLHYVNVRYEHTTAYSLVDLCIKGEMHGHAHTHTHTNTH